LKADEAVMVRLKEIAEKVSPSALTSYIRTDSVLFPKILRIREVEVEENINEL
jgi:hypothetical protein